MGIELSPLEFIDSRILALGREAQAARAKLSEIEHRLLELAVFREQFGQTANQKRDVQTDGVAENTAIGEKVGDLLGPTDAVLQLLKSHPEGLRPTEIANKIQEKITTRSSNPRRLVLSVIDGLKRKGRLSQDATGKIFLGEENRNGVTSNASIEPRSETVLIETPAAIREAIQE